MKAENKIEENSFEVALLLDSISQTKLVSDNLREMGLFSHFYNDLDELWVHLNTDSPDLIIIDVKKMSQGSLLFKNHPKVLRGELAIAFYYSEETKFLTNSTFKFDHYGYIKKELDIKGQLQTILRLRNNELHLNQENSELTNRVDRLKLRSQRLIEDNEIAFNFSNQFKKLQSLTSRFGEINTQADFYKQLLTIFSDWQDVKSFSVYHLGHEGQKLISPKFIRNKFKQLPDLWLTNTAKQGIDNYAQEMAHEVGFDLLGQDIRVLNIKSHYKFPELLIMAEYDEEKLINFQWSQFEQILSSSFMKMKLKLAEESPRSVYHVPVWKNLTYLDDIHFHQVKAKHKLIEVDFSNLVNIIKEKHSNRFYWNSFFQDITDVLEETLQGDFKFSFYGVQSLQVLIDNQYLEKDYKELSSVMANFQYWRYFENSSLMMNLNVSPKVKIVAPSSVNLLRQLSFDTSLTAQIPEQTHLNRLNHASRPMLDA